MNNEELQLLTEELSTTFFAKAFTHKATFNARLRTTGGRYLLRTHNIEINPKQYEAFGQTALEKIIKHELCHYHLHLEGRGYKHRDRDFKSLLHTVGGSLYCDVIEGTRNKSTVFHEYKCSKCSALYTRKRRINTKRYVCGKCRGKLEFKVSFRLEK